MSQEHADFHVSWGPDADKLSDAERKAIVESLRAGAIKRREEEQRAVKALEGMPYVAVPIEQLADMYKRFKRLTRMGQATVDEWLKMPDSEKALRHAIFREADFGAVFAGQWLPREVRDAVRIEVRSTPDSPVSPENPRQ